MRSDTLVFIGLGLRRLTYLTISCLTVVQVLSTLGEDRWYVLAGAVITVWGFYSPQKGEVTPDE